MSENAHHRPWQELGRILSRMGLASAGAGEPTPGAWRDRLVVFDPEAAGLLDDPAHAVPPGEADDPFMPGGDSEVRRRAWVRMIGRELAARICHDVE